MTHTRRRGTSSAAVVAALAMAFAAATVLEVAVTRRLPRAAPEADGSETDPSR